MEAGAKRGWQRARLGEIEPAGLAAEPGFWDEWTDDSGYAARWRSVRHRFGIRGFGANAVEGAAGEPLVVPHDETGFGGQEELYLVLRGRARFVCDGEELELGAGELLHVLPEARREATALETPTVLFMVGGVPGGAYTPWPGDS